VLINSAPGLPLDELNRLFAPVAGEPVIGVAVSGGQDSLGLLLLVHAWRTRMGRGPEIHVYSVDHGLRARSGEETRLVKSVAEQLGFAARILRWEGEKPKTGIQAAARAARYQLMGAAMKDDGAGILLTGHHRQDQAETVLMRLAHGSGLKGLAGMRAMSQLEAITVFRPLLEMEPEFLGQLVAKSGLSPVRDPSNDSDDFERVRWRKQLPLFAGLGLDSAALSRFARRAERADLAMAEYAGLQFERLVSQDTFGSLHVDLVTLNSQPEEIILRIVEKMVEQVSRKHIELAQLEGVQAQLEGARFSSQTLKGCVLGQHRGELLVFREQARIASHPLPLGPGNTIVWDQRFEIHNSGPDNLSVQGGSHLTRQQVNKFLGGTFCAPMASVKSAPVVSNIRQEILALGTRSLAPFVYVRHRSRA